MFDLFKYEFIQTAFVAGTLVALIAPVSGIFMVVKRYSGISDTLSHVALVGVMTGLFLDQSPLIWSILITVLVAILIEIIRQKSSLPAESILVLFLAGSLALVSILLSISGGFGVSLNGFLFGSITSLNWQDVFWIALVSFTVILVTFYFYKDFFRLVFNEEMAKISNQNVFLTRILLVGLAALVVSVGLQILGGLLVGSLMIIPVISAFQYRAGFRKTMVFAVILALFAVWIGLYSSFYLNLPPGGSIVMVSLILFGVSSLINKLG